MRRASSRHALNGQDRRACQGGVHIPAEILLPELVDEAALAECHEGLGVHARDDEAAAAALDVVMKFLEGVQPGGIQGGAHASCRGR